MSVEKILVSPENLAAALKLFPTIPISDGAEIPEENHESQMALSRAIFETMSAAAITMVSDGKITKINHAAAKLLGQDRNEIKGQQAFGFLTNKSGRSWAERVALKLVKKGELKEQRAYVRHSSERLIPVKFSISNVCLQGLIVRRVMLIEDVSNEAKLLTENKKMVKELKESATTDALTGCNNRRWLYQFFGSYVGRAQREGRALCTIFIDLDEFKRINDTISYEAGDQVLVDVAKAIRSCLRLEDAVVRLGGDEFLVIVVTETVQSLVVAARIWEEIQKVRIPKNGSLVPEGVTASLGVFPMEPSYLEDFNPEKPWLFIREVVGQADGAKQNVKQHGKNGIQLFTPKPPPVAPCSYRQ